jgi:hypothetical protein
VTSLSSTLGQRRLGRVEEVRRRQGEEARVYGKENEHMGWRRGLFIGVSSRAAEQHHDHKSQLNCTSVGDFKSKMMDF